MIHVYKIPKRRSNGYCFDGPVPIEFGNVDWISDPEPGRDVTPAKLVEWFEQKHYFKAAPSGTRFLVLCDLPGLTFQMVKP